MLLNVSTYANLWFKETVPDPLQNESVWKTGYHSFQDGQHFSWYQTWKHLLPKPLNALESNLRSLLSLTQHGRIRESVYRKGLRGKQSAWEISSTVYNADLASAKDAPVMKLTKDSLPEDPSIFPTVANAANPALLLHMIECANNLFAAANANVFNAFAMKRKANTNVHVLSWISDPMAGMGSDQK